MQLYPEIDFHESTITGFQSSGSGATLDLEDAFFRGQKQNISIELGGLRQLTRDGQLVDSVQMEAEDGEVLTLTLGPDRLHLIVEWNDFKAHTRHTRSYVCTCDKLNLVVK